ncbi:MAG: NAD(+) synthase [Eubacteriales bacterium]|nr:NAD(+) synthase [Eubacteriales bacterium]
MKDGFIKAATVTPAVRVADCDFNGKQILQSIRKLAGEGVKLAVWPELAVTGYTCGDLFLQDVLLNEAENALLKIAAGTAGAQILAVVGCPLRHGDKLYNCACFLYDGEVIGAVPKTFIPNYGEFYELRHFTPAPEHNDVIRLGGRDVPFGKRLLFRDKNLPAFTVAAEICEDLWVPDPPSAEHARRGATIVVNCSASDELTSKREYRRNLVVGQSARLVCGYLLANCGYGESTTDLVFTGQSFITENGKLLAESRPFESDTVVSEIDVNRLVAERKRMNSFFASQAEYTVIDFDMENVETTLTRPVEAMPFVPEEGLDERCDEIIMMQALGLRKRLEHTHCAKAIIGISGGLDSSLALLVAARAMKMLGRPMSDIITVTMPCFGTTGRTKNNAALLCRSLGTDFREIPIHESVRQHFADIGHDENKTDTTYENAQARERTQILMDIANMTNGLVVGTGDLSEAALGWSTYNGDHMSMYGVNCSIPKTLVRHLAAHEAKVTDNPGVREALLGIVDTPISPELLPPSDGVISQKTEELVGPYELHDFFLYYVVRWGFVPAKIYRLARYAFAGRFDDATIKTWLRTFYRRFFAQQFKRSCTPDGPKVGSVALSPRGDWRMPSDACATLWTRQAEEL